MVWIAVPVVICAIAGVFLAALAIVLGFPFLAVLIAAAEVVLIPALFVVMKAFAAADDAPESPPVRMPVRRDEAGAAERRPVSRPVLTVPSGEPAAH